VSIRTALVDENRFDALVIASALQNLGIEVVDIAHNFDLIDSLSNELPPEVVIISIDSDPIRAVLLAENIRKKHQDVGIVLITRTPDLRLIGISEKELPYGVQIILKTVVLDLHVLVDAIHRSIEDLITRSKVRWVTGTTFTSDNPFQTSLQKLTSVQLETLRLVAIGSSNAEIARIRTVTEKAVEHTITRILQALDITTNPRHNARVLLVREYYRFVNVVKHV
jgi:DNA-binding NarL/FixJ family response regulator